MADPTKHFDAPRPSGSVAKVLALGKTHWGVLLALLAVTTVIVFAGMAIVVADALAAALLAQAIEATPVVAVVDPQEADSQALGARLRALPGVAGATWRGKDDALKALVANGLPAPEGRNPLPDTWTLRLDPGSVLREPVSFAGWVDETSQRLKQVPGIGAIRVDQRWTTELDRRIADWRRIRTGAAVASLLVLVVVAGASGFLAGRALAGGIAGSDRVSVVTLVVLIEALGAFFFVTATAAVADAAWNIQSSPLLQRVFETQVVDERTVGAIALVGILAVLGVAVGIGVSRRQ